MYIIYKIYGKCPKISNSLFHTFWLSFAIMQMFLRILSGIANSEDL